MAYQPPTGPPPGYSRQQFSSSNPYNAHAGNRDQQLPDTDNSPPSPLPPSYGQEDYQAPVGPPPSHKKEQYQPPPGPPPSCDPNDPEPPPYDPWLAVPDNALLPPPPPMMEDYSPANNASNADARRARAWCKQNPLWEARTWSKDVLKQIDHHQFSLSAEPGTKAITISPAGSGRTSLSSTKRQGDTTVLSSLPLFTPQQQLHAAQQKTIYYQVHVKNISGSDSTVAIGFVAPPFPPNRLPGWHRGSLAIHNDDGRRYVNDDDGGIDFVRPFFAGERVGIGMTFTGSQFGPANVRVFFTRNGREEATWDLHESRDVDACEGGIVGLDGGTDLYAAIGICGGVELEVDWVAS